MDVSNRRLSEFNMCLKATREETGRKKRKKERIKRRNKEFEDVSTRISIFDLRDILVSCGLRH